MYMEMILDGKSKSEQVEVLLELMGDSDEYLPYDMSSHREKYGASFARTIRQDFYKALAKDEDAFISYFSKKVK